MTTTPIDAAKEVLRGYARANEAALASLLDVQDWPRIARQELERRATSIVQALDSANLEAIASGALDMQFMCQQVVADSSPQKSGSSPPTSDAWMHSYRRIDGGARYEQADIAPPEQHPEPAPGFVWVGARPLSFCVEVATRSDSDEMGFER